jgi:hypothetical protein
LVWGGHIFDDRTLEEFDEDCHFSCHDLSHQSSHSTDDCCFTYNFHNIDQILDQVGISWDQSKSQSFRYSTTYISFVWDLSTLQVSLSTSKKEKYSCAITEWKIWSAHILNNVKKLYGKLLHACLVIPSGHVYLTSLEAMLATDHLSLYVPQSTSKGVSTDLKW